MTTLLLVIGGESTTWIKETGGGDFLFQPLLLQWTEDGQSLFKHWPHELIRKKKNLLTISLSNHISERGGGSLRVGGGCWC